MSTPRNLGAFADNVASNGKLNIAGINATGTASSTTALKGDGTWGTVDSLPTQTGNTGKFLTTDGSAASWGSVPNPTFNDLAPTQTGNTGKFLTTDGTDASWDSVPNPTFDDLAPTQTGNSGKYLTTDGTTASWASIGGALDTPTFTASSTTPTGGATITVTITNYNSAYTYTIAISGGSYTFNTSTGVVSWTVPNVASTTSYSLTAFAEYGVQNSSVGTQTVSVQTSLAADTSISITDFAVYSANNGWAI